MKNLSLTSVILIIAISFSLRTYYSVSYKDKMYVTTWDALGYYLYLPGAFIHHDLKKLEWFDQVESEYNLSGGERYQYRELDNGNRVGKYLIGISLMESPFFLIAHCYALNSNEYKADGFSAPYQYALAYGVLVYYFLALLLLRNILSKYYKDWIVCASLLAIGLGTNLVQYTAVDGTLSHSFIFLLYTLILHFTIKWHENPKTFYASMIGLVIGFSIICRPTEAIMIFIPILWGIHDKNSRVKKWQQVKRYRTHIVYAIVFGALTILPQLLYWYHVSGSFVYNVGSKWQFFNPWFRVLFGFEKGWFIYTPITIFFILGMFFLKNKPYKWAVITFCLLNIWVIISWHEWRYGGSYSTRALVQSYPVFALPLAATIDKISESRTRIIALLVGAYLIIVNVFQVFQYNSGILLNDGMNRKYYSSIYLDTNPTSLDYSFLDTPEEYSGDQPFENLIFSIANEEVVIPDNGRHTLYMNELISDSDSDVWFLIKTKIYSQYGSENSRIGIEFINQNGVKESRIRLNHPGFSQNESCSYEFFFKVPSMSGQGQLGCFIYSERQYKGRIEKFEIFGL